MLYVIDDFLCACRIAHCTRNVDAFGKESLRNADLRHSKKEKLSGMGFEPMPTLVDQILSLAP